MDQSPFARLKEDVLDPTTDDREAVESAEVEDADTVSDSSVERILSESGDSAEDAPRQTLSTIGRSLVFKGDLTAKEDLLIQGRVEGTISHDAANLTIGPFADVRADIVARHVLVQGKIVGDVRASESVIVEPSANIRGDIFAPRIGLREGAKFKGQIDMTEDDDKAASPSKSRK